MSEPPLRKSRGSRTREHFLRPSKRSTPCVGICSTSHGDLVCRGCKRFYNEVRDWQEFTDEQRGMVMTRLGQLKEECVSATVQVLDEQTLYAKTDSYVADSNEDEVLRLYEAVAHCQGDFEGWGVTVNWQSRSIPTSESVLNQIESEFYERSQYLFRRYFRRQPT